MAGRAGSTGLKEPEAFTAEPFIPAGADLATLAKAALRCRGCPLWEDATRTVFGEGDPHARWMLVGEVPGDREDREGHPFVGPAGRVLDECLAEVGLHRSAGWLTNVVKHFKYKQSGKRRIHDRPRNLEIVACIPWLEREIELVRPDVIVCLGSTAAKALIARDFSVEARRGELVESALARHVYATVHPSALLRARAHRPEAWRDERARFVEDLGRLPALLAG